MGQFFLYLLLTTFLAKDPLRVYNSNLYISEGNALCKTHLKESEIDLLLRLGYPERRNYANPETLEYVYSSYSCQFLLRNGIIQEICLKLRPKAQRNEFWSTESHLYEEDLLGKSEGELIEKLNMHYQEKAFLQNQKIIFFKKGISFNIYKGDIVMICVFAKKNRPLN